MIEKDAAIRSGESMTMVSTGTRRPSWNRRSPCGRRLPAKPQIAAYGGGAAGTGPAEPLHDRSVDGPAVVQGALRRVDHQLLPHRHAVAVRGGKGVRPLDELSVALAHAHPLQVISGRRSSAPSSGSTRPMLLARADRDDHHRDVGVPGEERARAARAVRGAVDAEQHGRAGHPVPVQQVADGDEGRHPADALLAADVDGQLGGLVQVLGQRDRADLAASIRARSRVTRPVCCTVRSSGEHRLDPGPGVDRHRHHRQVFGQGQQPVGAQVVLEPEALDAAQQDAAGDARAVRTGPPARRRGTCPPIRCRSPK